MKGKFICLLFERKVYKLRLSLNILQRKDKKVDKRPFIPPHNKKKLTRKHTLLNT